MAAKRHGDVSVVEVAISDADRDLHQLQADLEAVLEQPAPRVVVDATPTAYMSSMLLGILISHVQRIRHAGGAILFHGLSERVLHELGLLGVAGMFECCPSVAEGVATLQGAGPGHASEGSASERRRAARVPMRQELWITGGRSFYNGYPYCTWTFDLSMVGIGFICCACGARECFALAGDDAGGCSLRDYGTWRQAAPPIVVSIGRDNPVRATAKVVHFTAASDGRGARVGARFGDLEGKEEEALGELLASRPEAP